MNKKRSFYYESREDIVAHRKHRADTIVFYFDLMEHYIKQKKIKGFKITSTKEKYGRFDITWMGGDNQIHEFVSSLEDATTKVCTKCGAPGILRRKLGWILPLCWRHYYPRIISITFRKRKRKLLNLFSK